MKLHFFFPISDTSKLQIQMVTGVSPSSSVVISPGLLSHPLPLTPWETPNVHLWLGVLESNVGEQNLACP